MAARQQERDQFRSRLQEQMAGRDDLPKGPLRRHPNSLDVISAMPGIQFTYMFRADQTEVALYLLSDDGTYGRLLARRAAIEARFGGPLDWLPREPGQVSRIRQIIASGGYLHREFWVAIQGEMLGTMARLYRAIDPFLTAPRPEDTQPTADPVDLDQRVARLLAYPRLTRPAGQAIPEREKVQRLSFARDPKVIAWVLQQARGRCELCHEAAPFERADGEPYLEVHHVRGLAEDGPDIVENVVALCPNCHRRLHYGADADRQRERLCDQVERLRRCVDGASE